MIRSLPLLLTACTAEALCRASGAECDPAQASTRTTGAGTDAGADGVIVLDPATLRFESVVVGETASASIDVQSDGEGDAVIERVQVDGPFSVDTGADLPITIAPGAAVRWTVAFAPTREGELEGELLLVTGGEPRRLTAALTGTGAPACPTCAPDIDVDTGGDPYFILDFYVSPGGAPDVRKVEISNLGDADLEVSDVYVNNDTFSGGIFGGGTFGVSGIDPPLTVAPGRTIEFSISYSSEVITADLPDAAGDQNVCHIRSDDPDSPDWVIELGGGAL